MIRPTIGRMVWYWPQGKTSGSPEDALIIAIHSDSLVDLFVVDPQGVSRSEKSVSLIHGDEATLPGERHCEWTLFQKEQAAKID